MKDKWGEAHGELCEAEHSLAGEVARILAIIFLVAVVAVVLTGCGGAKFLTFEAQEEAKQFHPPMPAPVTPISQEPVIVTPDIARTWNKEIDDGERTEYVVYGWMLQDWITMGQYDMRKDYYIRQLLELIKWYGHPDLQPAPEEEAAPTEAP